MAYVQPRRASREFTDAVLKQATRFVAVAAYATAVAIAILLLAPVLFDHEPGAAARAPRGPERIVYTGRPGDTPASIAAAHGLSLAGLFALNPKLSPFNKVAGRALVLGLR